VFELLPNAARFGSPAAGRDRTSQ